MQLIWKNISKIVCASLLVFTFACGDSSRTGDDAGEDNRENPNVEKQDETGDLPTQEHEDGSGGDEDEDAGGAGSTTTDSTQITPRSNS